MSSPTTLSTYIQRRNNVNLLCQSDVQLLKRINVGFWFDMRSYQKVYDALISAEDLLRVCDCDIICAKSSLRDGRMIKLYKWDGDIKGLLKKKNVYTQRKCIWYLCNVLSQKSG